MPTCNFCGIPCWKVGNDPNEHACCSTLCCIRFWTCAICWDCSDGRVQCCCFSCTDKKHQTTDPYKNHHGGVTTTAPAQQAMGYPHSAPPAGYTGANVGTTGYNTTDNLKPTY